MDEPSSTMAGRIEGGIDAIVIGENIDGLVIAGLLSSAGYTTILIENSADQVANKRQDFAPGFCCTLGENIVGHLDPVMIDELDLYRHGLKFLQRRMKSVYHFDKLPFLDALEQYGGNFVFNVLDFPEESDIVLEFLEELSLLSAKLGEYLQGKIIPDLEDTSLNHAATLAIDDGLSNQFQDVRIFQAILTEGQFGASTRPTDPYTFLSLVQKASGEIAGRQGAQGYIDGGQNGLKTALRRACQMKGVTFRRSDNITKILVEWDNVAGVELGDGGQIRAPVVITTLPAQQAYIEQIGYDRLGIDFLQSIKRTQSKLAVTEVAFGLSFTQGDRKIDDDDFFDKRHVATIAYDQLQSTLRKTRKGLISDELMLDVVFPTSYGQGSAPENSMIAHGFIYPVPNDLEKLKAENEALIKAASTAMRRILPDVGIEAVEFFDHANLKEARDPVLVEWSRARAITGASAIDGYFFAGDEAQIGLTTDGGVGRRVATEAMHYLKMVARG